MNEYKEVERIMDERKLRRKYCKEISNKLMNINQHDLADLFVGNNVNDEVEGHGWIDGSDFPVMEIHYEQNESNIGLVEIVARPYNHEYIGDTEITTEFQLSLVWYDRSYGYMNEFEIGTFDWHYGLYLDVQYIYPSKSHPIEVLKFLSEVKY